jgi:hypothetical protein
MEDSSSGDSVAVGDSIAKRYTNIQVRSAELGARLCEGYGLCVPSSESLSNFGNFPAAGLWFLIMYEVLVCSLVTLDSSEYMDKNIMDEQMDEYILDEK